MHYYTRFKNHEHSYQVCEQAQICSLSISDVNNNRMCAVDSQDLKLARACDYVPARFGQELCDSMAVTEVNSQFSVDSLLLSAKVLVYRSKDVCTSTELAAAGLI